MVRQKKILSLIRFEEPSSSIRTENFAFFTEYREKNILDIFLAWYLSGAPYTQQEIASLFLTQNIT